MINTENFTPSQIAAIENFIHGDSITATEPEHDGAFIIHFETGPTMIVERDGTVRDDIRP